MTAPNLDVNQHRDLAGRLLLLSIVVAAALQGEWWFSLALYLPDRARIQANHLARELALPPPDLDYGRPCVAVAAGLLREGSPFPFNYEADWENAAHRLRVQLVREARGRGARAGHPGAYRVLPA